MLPGRSERRLVELAAGCLAVADRGEGDRVTFTNLDGGSKRLLEAEFRMQPGTMRLVAILSLMAGVRRCGTATILHNGCRNRHQGADRVWARDRFGWLRRSSWAYEAWLEGGHAAFAPRDATQTELLTAYSADPAGASRRSGHSGKGIVNA